MITYFVENGGPVLEPDGRRDALYWLWDSDAQRGFWCTADGNLYSKSYHTYPSYWASKFTAVAQLPGMISPNMRIDEEF